MHGWRIDRAIHNYLYFTQYDRYVRLFIEGGRQVAGRLGRQGLAARAFKVVFDRYHGKVISKSDATKILSLDRDVKLGPEASERVIPFKYANRIILEEPDYIAVMDCPCRLSRDNPCLPVNVCIAVGRTTAQFWLEHGARLHARKISQAEALDLIRSERDQGHITTAWFKVATGGRTGVICSCCSCCCGGLEGMRLAAGVKGGDKVSNIIPSGYAVDHNPEKCETCGTCAETCMFGAVTLDSHGRPLYDLDTCLGCGLCVEKCPQSARSLVPDPRGILPLDLDLLEKAADV